MKFTVTDVFGTVLGTIDVTEDVYLDDDALLSVLVDAEYIDEADPCEVTEDVDNRVDIIEWESGNHLVSLVLIQ